MWLATLQLELKLLKIDYNGGNHLQNFHWGCIFVGYTCTFGNKVLRLRSRVTVKLYFRPYIRRYTSPNEYFEYSYPLNVPYILLSREEQPANTM